MRKIIALSLLVVFIIGAVLGITLPKRNQQTWAIYVKGDGLYARSLAKDKMPVLLAEGTGISNPILSLSRKQAAYIQEGRLILHDVKKGEGFVVTEAPRSFLFDQEGQLVVADTNGKVFRVDKKGNQTPVGGDGVYQDLVLSPKGTLYAHAYEKLNRGSQVVLRPVGIVREEKGSWVSALEGRKQSPSERDLGFAPKLAALSKDGEQAYIFHCPQSAALSADGVPMGVLDLKTGTYTAPTDTEQVLLPERSLLSESDIAGELAVTLGFGRNMNKQKSVGILRPADGSFRPASGEGMVAMMPSLSASGSRLLYITAEEEADMDRWMHLPKSVTEVDLTTGEVTVCSKENTVYLSP
ncbi:MAG: hypothetical protein II351_01475, partial [Clostridia bacterium]|nr:hypothetical protein [Clostridia bacterium]